MVLFLLFANHQPSGLFFEPLLCRLHIVWSDVLPTLCLVISLEFAFRA